MVSFIPDLEARMRAQEAMSTIIHAHVHEVEREKAAKTDVAEIKDEITQVKGQIGARHTEMHEVEREKATKTDVAEIKDEITQVKGQMQGFERSVEERFNTFEHSVNERFEHVYGEFADLKADTAEIRNMLATLIERQEQQK